MTEHPPVFAALRIIADSIMPGLRQFTAHAPFSTRDTSHDLVAPHECAVYEFWAADDVLLYVGVAWNPGRRWETHRRRAAWFTDAVRAVVTVYPDEATALAVERELIRTAKPRHNRRSATT